MDRMPARAILGGRVSSREKPTAKRAMINLLSETAPISAQEMPERSVVTITCEEVVKIVNNHFKIVLANV